MRLMLLSFILIILSACAGKTDKDFFVYSSTGMNHDFSVKYNFQDTLYMSTRFPEKATFYALLKKEDHSRIKNLIKEINFDKHDSVYEDSTLRDGWGYKFYNYRDAKAKSIYVYTTTPPKDLDTIARQFEQILMQRNFNTITKEVDFGNLNHILLPTPPPPPSRIIIN
ncbi:hypothetical protein LRS05_08520 [Flavobacterium sp. J372]|uniref:hypothetical protein n=1 Tax=Flavobacterium sp. J372 TaxID=2898436 RepID=UPI002150A9EC|nr:hypothetical protein [Flavobacterium sp. J372]MCR5862184.1 hypothetical protein [Flavobacterium sp. J372]